LHCHQSPKTKRKKVGKQQTCLQALIHRNYKLLQGHVQATLEACVQNISDFDSKHDPRMHQYTKILGLREVSVEDCHV